MMAQVEESLGPAVSTISRLDDFDLNPSHFP
jgi:hypothetical protein